MSLKWLRESVRALQRHSKTSPHKEENMLWILLLEIVVGLIIATLWGMILYGMLTSGSLVLTISGLVIIAWLVYEAWKANYTNSK